MLISFHSSHHNELKSFLKQNNITDDGLLSNFPMRQLFIEAKNNDFYIEHLNKIKNLKEVDLFIFFDFIDLDKTKIFKSKNMLAPKILFIREPKSIMPNIWNTKNHSQFDRVYTYDDDLVDLKKYFKFFEPNLNEELIINENKINNYVMFSSNKYAYSNDELYSKRFDIINWFENNYYDEFDLFGNGWDKKLFTFKTAKFLNKLQYNSFFKYFRKKKFKSYKGFVDNKKEMLRKYKFSFCLENSICNGYITEKIFDCLYAGVIPIYLGAPNIEDYVDKDCFIDMRDFSNISSIYNYTTNLDHNEYSKFLINAKKYLKNDKNMKFSYKNCINFFIDIFLEFQKK